MKQFVKEVIAWLTINGGFAAVLYYGYYEHISWCVTASLWLLGGYCLIAAFSFFGAMFVKRFVAKINTIEMLRNFMSGDKTLKKIPIWCSYVYNVVLISFLVFVGQYPFVITYFVACVAGMFAYSWIKQAYATAGAKLAVLEAEQSAADRFRDNRVWEEEDDTPEDTFGDDDLFRLGVTDNPESQD